MTFQTPMNTKYLNIKCGTVIIRLEGIRKYLKYFPIASTPIFNKGGIVDGINNHFPAILPHSYNKPDPRINWMVFHRNNR
jgi:hypothetical protein